MVCDIVTPAVISGLQQYNLTATHFMTQWLIKGEAAVELQCDATEVLHQVAKTKRVTLIFFNFTMTVE